MHKMYDNAVTLLQRPEIKRFMRFLLIGASNTLIGFVTYLAVLTLLPKTRGMVSIAQAISYSIGILWSYVWNRIWVFGSNDKHVAKEGGRFLALQVFLLLTSAALIGLLVDYFNSQRVWAWVIVMGFITVLNYFLLRLWAFRNYEDDKIHRY
jgi:putative flippase GtrA